MLSRDQSVNLHPGQQVRVNTMLANNVVGSIAKITVPANGARVIEVNKLVVDGKSWWEPRSIFVTAGLVELV